MATPMPKREAALFRQNSAILPGAKLRRVISNSQALPCRSGIRKRAMRHLAPTEDCTLSQRQTPLDCNNLPRSIDTKYCGLARLRFATVARGARHTAARLDSRLLSRSSGGSSVPMSGGRHRDQPVRHRVPILSPSRWRRRAAQRDGNDIRSLAARPAGTVRADSV